MNTLIKCFFSMQAMAVLLLLFALSCAAATFIENDFGTETAWAVVYAAKWFELLQILLGANLLYNILLFRLYKKDKIPAFLFHVSLLFILLGSGLTRYAGYEGTLHVREGESANSVMSSDSYVQFQAYQNNNLVSGINHKQLISRLGGNDFSFSWDVNGFPAKVNFKEYIPNAVSQIIDDDNGAPLISLSVSTDEAFSFLLKEGSSREIDGTLFLFNTDATELTQPYVKLEFANGNFTLVSNQNIEWFKMNDNTKGVYEKEKKQSFDAGHLYTINGMNFAAKYAGVGKEKLVSSSDAMYQGYDALIATIDYKNEEKEIVLAGHGKGSYGAPATASIDDTVFVATWGAMEFTLPFSIKLDDFQLERYPGSNAPSSYASEVVVEDAENSVEMPFRIYMNHVLDYDGFRFFQASYDEDEQGTILSVNKDPGKAPTYIGYFLLSLGLLLNIFNPKSRFRKLAKDIHKNITSASGKSAAALLIALYCLNPISANAQNANITTDQASVKKHAELFGTILTQSMDGRIYPVNTIAHEILNKVYRSDSVEGLGAEEVLFELLHNPEEWQNKPLVYVSHPELRKLLGIKGKHASYNDFIDAEKEEYKLKQVSEIAERKKDSERNTFDKDVIKVEERLNIVFSTFSWDMLRIIPKINDANHEWFSINNALQFFATEEAMNARMMIGAYFESVKNARADGNWTNADKMVEIIKNFQKKQSGDIIPSDARIKAEIFFNKAKIFDRIYPVYLLSGFALLLLIFARMATPKINIHKIIKVFFAISFFAFIVHTAGLILRWYVAQHAPWSNSYESMIYIAWAIALSGLFFSRTSIISMSLAYIVAGITLFTAHLGWMDPHITNLVPVLKSHWLTIHVSVITASYGFLGLCALLGFFVLMSYIWSGFGKNQREIERNMTEATKINEMSMILGLSLLTIGNFLGGVWANESWGRYWGWDPKETWSLISIIIYAIIVHFRFIPKLNNQFAFAIASTLSYFSILMTYFGVNFYLSGKHSYASGDPVPMPMFVWVIIAVIALVIVLASVVIAQNKKRGQELNKL